MQKVHVLLIEDQAEFRDMLSSALIVPALKCRSSRSGGRLPFLIGFAKLPQRGMKRVDENHEAFVYRLRHLKPAARLDVGETVQSGSYNTDGVNRAIVSNPIASDDRIANRDHT